VRIVHIINSLEPGGAETLLCNSLVAGNFTQIHQHQLIIFNSESFLRERLSDNVTFVNLRYNGIFDLPRLILALRKHIIEFKADIIHTHLVPSSLYTFIAKPKNMPQVHTLHTTYSLDKENSKILLWLERLFYYGSAKANTIVLSEYTKKDFTNVLKYKGGLYTLGNFIPDKFFTQPKIQFNTKIKLVSVGRLNDTKNYNYLIEVLGFLKHTKISVDVYGRGDVEAYNLQAKKLGANVNFLGAVENVETRLKEYDAFILCSKFEGFPLSVTEAMAAGLPCLLSDIEPLKQLFDSNASYFSLNNAKLAAEQIAATLNNVTALCNLSTSGFNFVNNYCRLKNYTKLLTSIYKNVLLKK
jgi:glycosyltransferase involved in cell wall biosynthesis